MRHLIGKAPQILKTQWAFFAFCVWFADEAVGRVRVSAKCGVGAMFGGVNAIF